jgi:hypothetical protein
LKSFFACAAVAAALVAPGVASASTENLDFSGLGQFGPISGQMVLDVVGGVAVSGTGSISGVGIPGTEALTLITPETPGASGYPSGIGWRDGNGTDTWGWDNVVPIDYVGGLDFSFGAGSSPPSWGHGWQFGIWNNDGVGGPGGGYEAWMSGPGGGIYNFYGTTGTLTVSPGVPEPSTWVMILLGFVGLGYLGYRKAGSTGSLPRLISTAA